MSRTRRLRTVGAALVGAMLLSLVPGGGTATPGADAAAARPDTGHGAGMTMGTHEPSAHRSIGAAEGAGSRVVGHGPDRERRARGRSQDSPPTIGARRTPSPPCHGVTPDDALDAHCPCGCDQRTTAAPASAMPPALPSRTLARPAVGRHLLSAHVGTGPLSPPVALPEPVPLDLSARS